jgi:hypothetical protein
MHRPDSAENTALTNRKARLYSVRIGVTMKLTALIEP